MTAQTKTDSLLNGADTISIPETNSLLAEHMLPDGAHDRSDDWTIFYLNQIPPLTTKSGQPSNHDNGRGSSRANRGYDRYGDDAGTNLLYVISLVRTKKVATVRRGALVKALAIAVRYPYIQIYKPVLLLALDDYFDEPSIACLQRLYSAVNSMNVTNLPRLTLDERKILRTSERKDIFDEKHVSAPSPSDTDIEPMTGLSSSGTNGAAGHSLRASPSTEFSTSSDSLQFPTNQVSSTEEGPGSHASGKGHSDTSTSFTADPYEFGRIGGSDSAFRISQSSKTDLVGSVSSNKRSPRDTHWYETTVNYKDRPLPMRIPLGTFPEEVGDYSLIKLIQTFSNPGSLIPGPLHPELHSNGLTTHPIVLLFNALVTYKRVVFLGHGHPASSVANFVLAACALGSGSGSVLKGFTGRSFPYTNLSNLDNLQNVPGYIAGVCNPAFADRPGWWDVLCNIDTGKVTVSKDLRASAGALSSMAASRTFLPSSLRHRQQFESHYNIYDDLGGPNQSNGSTAGTGSQIKAADSGKIESPDTSFLEEVLSAISAHYGEMVIRARFTDYLIRFIRLASRYEEEVEGTTSIGFPTASFTSAVPGQQADVLGSGFVFPDDTTAARELTANSGRIEGWRATPSYSQYQQDFRASLQHAPLRAFDITHQLTRLRHGRRMSSLEAGSILRTLSIHSQTDEEVIAVLAHLPPHYGGLLPFAFGLLHPVPKVQSYAINLFISLESHPTGRKTLQSLNAFHRSAYSRLLKDRNNSLQNQPSLLQQNQNRQQQQQQKKQHQQQHQQEHQSVSRVPEHQGELQTSSTRSTLVIGA